jgi:hypothetical protein
LRAEAGDRGEELVAQPRAHAGRGAVPDPFPGPGAQRLAGHGDGQADHVAAHRSPVMDEHRGDDPGQQDRLGDGAERAEGGSDPEAGQPGPQNGKLADQTGIQRSPATRAAAAGLSHAGHRRLGR